MSLARLLWRLRGARYVAVHMVSGRGVNFTVEGVLAGRWDGHYHLLRAKVAEAEGVTSPELEGDGVLVPTENVLFVQVLGKGMR